MRNWKISPKDSSVAQYIDCYWLLEKSPGDAGPQFPKLNPDPAAHLIIANIQQPYCYAQDSYSASGSGSHLILPYRKTYTLDHSQPFIALGIKLKVGALYSIPLSPTHPLLDEVIPLDIKNQLHISPANEAILLTQGVNQGLNQSTEEAEVYRDTLDILLQPLISRVKEDKHSSLVRKILGVFSDMAQTDIALANIGDKLGCSQRTIERSFSKVTGMTLKQYQSMQRLEAMLDHLHKLAASEINWTRVALTFGFSDQPHLIRYLKTTLGSTPGKYAEQRDLAIDTYGNFE